MACNEIVRAIKCNTYLTSKKLRLLQKYIAEYNRAVNTYINLLWSSPDFIKGISPFTINNVKYKSIGNKEFYTLVNSDILNSRVLSSGAARIAAGLVQSAKSNKGSKPKYNSKTIQLDNQSYSRKEATNSKNFDLWLKLGVPTNCDPKFKNFYIPVKLHSRINGYLNGNSSWLNNVQSVDNKLAVTLSTDGFITFSCKLVIPKKKSGDVVGVDLGMNALITTSDGNKFGEDFNNRYIKLLSLYKDKKNPDKNPNRQKSTRGYKKRRLLLENEIHRAVNSFFNNYENLGVIIMENLTNISTNTKKKKVYRSQRKDLSKWGQSILTRALKEGAENRGIEYRTINPFMTSSKCFKCDNLQKIGTNRIFECQKCGYKEDRDINAANNILKNYIESKFGEKFKGKEYTLLYA